MQDRISLPVDVYNAMVQHINAVKTHTVNDAFMLLRAIDQTKEIIKVDDTPKKQAPPIPSGPPKTTEKKAPVKK